MPLYYFVVLYRLRRYLNPQDADLEEISDDDVGEEQAALEGADDGGEAGLPCGDDDADDGGEAGLSSDLDDAGTEANEAKAADEVEQSSDDGVELPGGEEEPAVVITQDSPAVSLDDVVTSTDLPPERRIITLETAYGDPDGLVIRTEDPRSSHPPVPRSVEPRPESDGYSGLSCLCVVDANSQDVDVPVRTRTPPTPPASFDYEAAARGDSPPGKLLRFGGAPGAPDADAAVARRLSGARPSRRLSAATALQRNSMILEATEEMRAVELEAKRLEYRELYSKDVIAGVQFLVEEYEPRCWWFSVFDCVRRIAMTGGLLIFSDGGALQIAMGASFSFLFF